ncbi:NAD(P)H-hydrate_epimerase [Hexamita inflata]|uniref:NAD(P)H-hydrate epimerase n=1 Tax=Hexamita inflata TaxID=28002 RepID=A0AA86TQL9_9EUKA|nr:NAD(P)H-hydrate epimerase [Hexamita inflata]
MQSITAKQAQLLDQKLFEHFSLEVLMELAGQAAALAIFDYLKASNQLDKNICVVCGPGNNGGDGLVIARWLVVLGIPSVQISVQCARTRFNTLIKQLELYSIQFSSSIDIINSAEIIIDCIFGFSFVSGQVKPPYNQIISIFHSKHVISVDVPSSWPVDDQPLEPVFTPKCVVSLSCVKECGIWAQKMGAVHYLAANIVPRNLREEFGLQFLEDFKGLFMKIE